MNCEVNRDKKKVIFFGCALDPDERDESIREKLSCMNRGRTDYDPYLQVMRIIETEVDAEQFEAIGSLEVPSWLCPLPASDEKAYINVDNFVAFIDGDECRTFARMISEHVIDEILPRISCMIAVDHSLTGGVFEKIAAYYGPEAVSLIVLDSHTDAVPVSLLAGAIAYDMETNPSSPYDPSDPFLHGRVDTFNASSFLYHLLDEGAVIPENLYILGVSDYPVKRSFRIKDDRIRRYVGVYAGLKKRGVRILTKKDLLSGSARIRAALRSIRTPYVYVSIDMDIGAGNALDGVRFRNWKGMNEKQIYRIAGHIGELLNDGVRLAGMDLTEFNPRRADVSQDRTYRIGANFIRRLCFGLDEIP